MTSFFDKDLLSRFPALTGNVTASSAPKTTASRLIVCQLDQYEVVLAVTEDDRVLYVAEVREKKDFRSVRQKIASTEHFDVERYINE
jgi:hypothetical protein